MAVCVWYIVHDVATSIDFYTRHLGFRVEVAPSPAFAEIPCGDPHLYLTGPGQDMGGGAAMVAASRSRRVAASASTLTLEDLDATVARLRAAGCRFRNGAIQGGGGKQILLEEPSGNLVEQLEPGTAAPRAPGSGTRGGGGRLRAAGCRFRNGAIQGVGGK